MKVIKSSSKNSLLRSSNSSGNLETSTSPLILRKQSSFKPSCSHSPEKQLNSKIDSFHFTNKEIYPIRHQRFEEFLHAGVPNNRNIILPPQLCSQVPSQQNISLLQNSPKKKTLMGDFTFLQDEPFLLDGAPSQHILRRMRSNNIQQISISQHPQSGILKKNSIDNNCPKIDNIQLADDNEEEEEDYEIWDNSFFQGLGLDIENNFEEITQQNFVQLFYLRSQLYQDINVTKVDVLDEMGVITSLNNVELNVFQSSKQIDQIEHKYNISLRKNARQIAKLSFIPRRKFHSVQPSGSPELSPSKNPLNNVVLSRKPSKCLPMNTHVNVSPPSRILKNRPYPQQLIPASRQKCNFFYPELNGQRIINQINQNGKAKLLEENNNQLIRVSSQNNLNIPNKQDLNKREEESSSPLLRNKKVSQMKAQLKLNASKGLFQSRRYVQVDPNNISSIFSACLQKQQQQNHQQVNGFQRTKNGTEISLFKKIEKSPIILCQVPCVEQIPA